MMTLYADYKIEVDYFIIREIGIRHSGLFSYG